MGCVGIVIALRQHLHLGLTGLCSGGVRKAGTTCFSCFATPFVLMQLNIAPVAVHEHVRGVGCVGIVVAVREHFNMSLPGLCVRGE